MIAEAGLTVWGFMTLQWITSIFIRNVSIVDTLFSLNYVLIVSVYYFLSPSHDHFDQLFIIFVTIWALRLSIHIGVKNFGIGEEPRYQRFREYYGKHRYWWFSYFQVFLLQGVFLMIFASPIHVNFYQAPTTWYGQELTTSILILLFVTAFCYEAIADFQLYRFKQTAQPKAILTTGLWYYSRHPNYFGELALWYVLALLAIAKSPSLFSLLSLIGPIFQTYVMAELSGPKNHEPHMQDRPGFKDYQASTPAIIPNFFKDK
ncbi:MAG: DUF1295 domain-containing protein [Pseudomonadota bacterium]|nr:DUF1295 domain-containing protein [Pseudomonadota bacterium]